MSQIELIQTFGQECPYCGTGFTVEVDNTTVHHEMVEDCRICCAPILIRIERDYSGEITQVLVSKENE
jgi:hypothetical protein